MYVNRDINSKTMTLNRNNTSNLRHLGLLGSNSITGKFNNAKISSGVMIADAKTSKNNLGCSVSISKESKTMLEKLNEEKKQSEQALVSESKSLSTDSNNHKILETTVSFADDKYKMIHEAYQCNDSKNAGTLNFEKLASAYEEIKENLKSQYTGEELEEHLSLLDKDYEDTLVYIANRVKQAINFREKTEGKEGAVKAIEAIFGKNMNEMNEMLGTMGIDKNQSFMDSIDAIIKLLAQQVRESSK